MGRGPGEGTVARRGDQPRRPAATAAVRETEVERPRSNFAYFAKRAATDEMASHGGAGELAFFDVPIDPSTVFATLQQMLGDAVKP